VCELVNKEAKANKPLIGKQTNKQTNKQRNEIQIEKSPHSHLSNPNSIQFKRELNIKSVEMKQTKRKRERMRETNKRNDPRNANPSRSV
jgi:hypothetical protein